ncbi:MAG: IS66 family transposase [Devosia sp.]|nr:IS66 family transposase [Devosia sp.]
MTQASDLPDKDAVIAALIARIEMLVAENARLAGRVVELEAKLGLPPKTPDNSSVPPSKGQKPSGSSVPKAKAKPHRGAHRPLHPNPTSKREVLANTCKGCGADVSGVVQIVCEQYDRVEIPRIEPNVTRVLLHGGVCPCCRKRFKAEPPAGLEPGSPFGPNLGALVIYLRSVQAIPLARLREVMGELLGLDISEGALVNILSASAKPFAATVERIKARLLAGTAIASDETGIRVGKANWWLWVFHHADSAVFVADKHRSKAVVQAFLGDHRPDYWISDRYGGQMGWARREHQVCLAHLIRDVQYAIDEGDTVLGPSVKGLLKRACAIGRRRADLSEATLKSYEADLDRRLDRIMAVAPVHPAGIKLQTIIKKTRRHLFVFVQNRDLSATNNGSERALRPCAVYRKITNGFRSEWGAVLYADIRSVVETARRRSIRAIDAIRLTLDERPLPIGT